MGAYFSLLEDEDPVARLASPDICDDRTWENTLRNRSSFTVLDHLEFYAATRQVWENAPRPTVDDIDSESSGSIDDVYTTWAGTANKFHDRNPLREEHTPRGPEATRRKRLGFAPNVVVVFDSEKPASHIVATVPGAVDSESDDDDSFDALGMAFI